MNNAVSDTADTAERDFEENPPTAADFRHLDHGLTVTVLNRVTTWEPGDDRQAEVVLEAGTQANVVDWVEEWFHVHVRTNYGQHAWVSPDELQAYLRGVSRKADEPDTTYTMTDQPMDCPQCQWRTEFVEITNMLQLHACPNEECRFVFYAGWDEDEIDEHGNWIDPSDTDTEED
jgi:hypothetical protein